MLVCALCVAPVFMAARVSKLWLAVGLVALAASGHCGFAANLYTVVIRRLASGTADGIRYRHR